MPEKSTGILENVSKLPAWDDIVALFRLSPASQDWLTAFEGKISLLYSEPLDLDFAMLRAFPAAYGLEATELETPDESMIVAVLGKSHGAVNQYTEEEKTFFAAYHKRFKTQSKPAAHLSALSKLNDVQLSAGLPQFLGRVVVRAKAALAEHPE
jgi:hypothetical protein